MLKWMQIDLKVTSERMKAVDSSRRRLQRQSRRDRHSTVKEIGVTKPHLENDGETQKNGYEWISQRQFENLRHFNVKD